MITMCLRHFTHPVTGRTGWWCGIEFPDRLIDNIDVEADADLIAAMIADHQPEAIDVRENVAAPDFDRVLDIAAQRKRLRSLVRHTDPKFTATKEG